MGASPTRTLLLLPPNNTLLEITTLDFVTLGSVRLSFSLDHDKVVEFQVSSTCEMKWIENLHDKNNALPEY